MNRFSSFKITASEKGFTGDKIKITKILDKEITVLAHKIEQSKKFPEMECLHLQISYRDEKYIIFTSAQALIEMIQKVPKDKGYPFTTIIIKDGERYLFT